MADATRRTDRRIPLTIVAGMVVALGAIPVGDAPPARAQAGEPRILHMPLRWCVLEGTRAARRNPTAAVLERIRRANSILVPQAGISLRSPVTSALGVQVGFPVIADPRPNIGRRGDVVVPIESTGEYRLVMERCEQAWRRLERLAGPGSDLGAVARGPTAVIIRQFVTSRGAPITNVWGYAFAVSASGNLCAAANPTVRSASGGSLMVVDSSDGHPSPQLDRRLVAHEFGHVLRLGHGDGLDNPGSIPGRIDKFCDDTENPDPVPGSLMSSNLRYERVTPWQRRLPRNVASRHPATVEDRPVIRLRPPRARRELLQRLANGGSRVIVRFLPPGHGPLSPLARLTTAGVRGAQVWDSLRDHGERRATGAADLQAFGVSEDAESGDVVIWWEPVGEPGGGGVESEFDAFVDADGDPATGGDLGSIVGNPFPAWETLVAELVTRIRIVGGVPSAQVWWWDAPTMAWQEILPAPEVRLAESAGEDDDEVAAKAVELSLPAGLVDLSGRVGMGGQLRTILADGREVVDGLPEDVASGGTEPMSLEEADYPVCAINRDAFLPGVADAGGRLTLEALGFGADGPVSIWLGDGAEPIATGDYWEIPDDPWPWVAKIELPSEVEPGMHMVQVAFEGSGMTADCPVVIGSAELPDWDALPDPDEFAGSDG